MRRTFRSYAVLSALLFAARAAEAALPVGASVSWSNTCSECELASTAARPIADCNFSFCLPPSGDLLPGMSVRIDEIRLASVNDAFSERRDTHACDAAYAMLEGVRSERVEFLGPGTIRSGANAADHALVYRFKRSCVVRVGQRYVAPWGARTLPGFALLQSNGRLLRVAESDRATCRYVRRAYRAGWGVLARRGNFAYEPVYEVRGTVVPTGADDPHFVMVTGDTSVDFGEAKAVEGLSILGSGRLTVVGGRAAVTGRLTVAGDVEMDASALDLSAAAVKVESGATFTYRVDGEGGRIRSVEGPGRLVKRGKGELRLAGGQRTRQRIGGQLELLVEEGRVAVDGMDAAVAWGDVRIELLPMGKIGCIGPQCLSGRIEIAYNGSGEKRVFTSADQNPVRIFGEGAFVQRGMGRLAVAAEWDVKGPVVSSSALRFERPFLQPPTHIAGAVTVGGSEDMAPNAGDGPLLHVVSFDGAVFDRGARPFHFKWDVVGGQRYVPSRFGSAYWLTDREPATRLYCEEPPFEPGDFTVVLLAKTEARDRAVLATFGSPRSRALVLHTNTDGQLVLSRWRNRNAEASTPPARVNHPMKLYHTYALVYEASRRRVTFVADSREVGSLPLDDARFGGFQLGAPYCGLVEDKTPYARSMYVDEMRIYGKALAPARIGELFRPPAAPGVVVSFFRYVQAHRLASLSVALIVLFLLAVVVLVVLAADSSLRAQRLFFSTVSHDIRTPLSAIIGFAELLSDRNAREEDCRRYARLVAAGGRMLSRLVDDVIDLSRLRSGRLEIHPEPTDVRQLAADVVGTFEVIRSDKGLRLDCVLDAMPKLEVDPQRLRQILYNLVSNALKNTERGEVRVSMRWSGGRLTLAVADTGCGISPEDIAHILRPFVQAKGLGRGGTGLGLVVCQGLLKAMHGTLGVESEVGNGSTFTVELEATEAKTEGGNAAAARGDAIAPSGPAEPAPDVVRHVLVVDDSPVNLAVLKAMLAKCGPVQTLTAANGREALAALKAHPETDLVLTDLWMPEMDGEGLVRAIRGDASLAQLPVYLITADVDAVGRMDQCGFTGILLKPISHDAIRGLIKDGKFTPPPTLSVEP